MNYFFGDLLNFPVGVVSFKGDVPLDLPSVAQQLFELKLNGYIVLSVKGNLVEEGILFFREGEGIACIVECLAIDRTLKGNEALEFFLNQTKGKGFFQCVELTKSQVDLIIAFDEKLLINKIVLKELPKMIPLVFSTKFEREESKVNALETYGLGELK